MRIVSTTFPKKPEDITPEVLRKVLLLQWKALDHIPNGLLNLLESKGYVPDLREGLGGIHADPSKVWKIFLEEIEPAIAGYMLPRNPAYKCTSKSKSGNEQGKSRVTTTYWKQSLLSELADRRMRILSIYCWLDAAQQGLVQALRYWCLCFEDEVVAWDEKGKLNEEGFQNFTTSEVLGLLSIEQMLSTGFQPFYLCHQFVSISKPASQQNNLGQKLVTFNMPRHSAYSESVLVDIFPKSAKTITLFGDQQTINLDGVEVALPPIYPGSVLDDLRTVGTLLAKNFQWTLLAAYRFILCGTLPIRRASSWVSLSTSTLDISALSQAEDKNQVGVPDVIHLTLPIWTNADEVARLWKSEQRKRLGYMNQPLDEQEIALLHHVAGQRWLRQITGSGTIRQRREIFNDWNEKVGQPEDVHDFFSIGNTKADGSKMSRKDYPDMRSFYKHHKACEERLLRTMPKTAEDSPDENNVRFAALASGGDLVIPFGENKVEMLSEAAQLSLPREAFLKLIRKMILHSKTFDKKQDAKA